jgi:hypothetical protein
MNDRHFWTEERRDRLRTYAASRMFASDIALQLGVTKLSILTVCAKHGIELNKHTEIELADIRAKDRAREKRKRLKKQTARSPVASKVIVAIGTSRTAPIYRNQLPRVPEMSKNALREMFAKAARNTAEMPV